jgi:transcriptional regulator with XRE-family HTH domain
MQTVGDRIRQVREQLGLTQETVAGSAGLSKGFISEVENNKRNISAQNLLKVANALSASVQYLLEGGEYQRRENRPVVIPSELSKAAEQLRLSYAQTLSLLETYESVIARRRKAKNKMFTVDDWIDLHHAIDKVFGNESSSR